MCILLMAEWRMALVTVVHAPSIKYQFILIVVCALCNSCWSCTIEGNETCGAKCDYTDLTYNADCRRRSLTSVPRECCMSQTLDLRYNQITVLNDGDFAGFSDIIHLDIEFNSMTDISPSAFHDSPKLDILYAQFNLLTTIHKNNFAGAPNLRKLSLNYNNISKMESGAFDDNPNLQILYLSSNHISKLSSDSFQELTKLVDLSMENNSISVIPNNTFTGLTQLKYLSLGQNKLTNIHSQMFEDLQNLIFLNLSSNFIISISLPEFPNLKHLDLFDNALKQVDDLTCYFDKLNLRKRRSNHTHKLEKVYLAKNPLICSCSLKPLQRWLINHTGSLGNDPRANATCFDSTKKVTVWLQHKNTSQICPIKTTTPLTPTTTDLPTEYENTPLTFTTTDLPTDYEDKYLMVIVLLTICIIVFCIMTVFGVLRFCKRKQSTSGKETVI